MAKLRALIVEDETLIAEDLRLILQKLGHDVIAIASQGTEAVQQAITGHPDMVLMDVRLRGPMDGIEAARKIRSQADIPIVYLTAHASALASMEIDDRCTRLGKPFSPAQLEAAIESILRTKKRTQL